jgi:hypothetical protein
MKFDGSIRCAIGVRLVVEKSDACRYLWQPCIFSRGAEALSMTGRYFDKCRHENGLWLFEHVQIELRMLSRYDRAGLAVA